MSFSSFITWVAGNIVTAAQLNQQVRDNGNYLLNRPGTRIIRNNAGDYSTASTTFVDIDSTNLTITLAMSGAAVLVTFTAVTHTMGANLMLDFVIDGTRYGAANTQGLCLVTGTNTVAQYSVLVTGLSAASHTFKPQFAVASAGTSTLYSAVANTPVTFSVQEVA